MTVPFKTFWKPRPPMPVAQPDHGTAIKIGLGSNLRELEVVEFGPDWVKYENGWKFRTEPHPDGVNRWGNERIFE